MLSSYDGKTPIYLLMDYIAKHPKEECANAEGILSIILSRKDFDVNQRYSTLLPPLVYLIRENKKFLNGSFSKKYISDNALKLLIEHGASINAYDEEGNSLMSFAQDTQNSYLQSYFINNGINLLHVNSDGNNSIFGLIKDGDLDLLKQALGWSSFDLSVNTLKNDPATFKKHEPMYEFIANECATKAAVYDDVALFRRKFPDKHYLVQKKYDAIFRQEIEQAKTYKDFVRCRERFSDMNSAIDSKLHGLYIDDCTRLDEFYRQLLLEANKLELNSLHYSVKHYDFVNDFIDSYQNKFKYDPDHKVGLALTLQRVYDVIRGLSLQLPDSYLGYEDITNPADKLLSLGLYSELKPVFKMNKAKKDMELIVKALKICASNNDQVFSKYYSFAQKKIERKKELFIELYNRSRDEYQKEAAVYNQEVTIQQSLCDNCRIDESKTIFPREEESGIFIRTTTKYDGEIVMKNGDKYYWTIEDGLWKINKSDTGFISQSSYKNFKDMIQRLIKHCERKYCN